MYPKELGRELKRVEEEMGFNSLQTGKCIQSEQAEKLLDIDIQEFQFPSNGKVYSKRRQVSDNRYCQCWFQFPSNGKVYSKSRASRECYEYGQMRFNSLQTGKCIQSSKWEKARADISRVSIPFKRESVFKVIILWLIIFRRSLFQFPSNGKVYSKSGITFNTTHAKNFVSIPFKRESVFKVNRYMVYKFV